MLVVARLEGHHLGLSVVIALHLVNVIDEVGELVGGCVAEAGVAEVFSVCLVLRLTCLSWMKVLVHLVACDVTIVSVLMIVSVQMISLLRRMHLRMAIFITLRQDMLLN